VKALTPFAVVLRLSGFQLSQADLEARLKAAVERYSLDKGGYAQVSIESDEPGWKIIDELLQRHGPAIKTLRSGGEIQSVCLDLAYDFNEGSARTSYTVPAQTAALAGSHGINLELSIYLTAP
jgi:hypothetical protein